MLHNLKLMTLGRDDLRLYFEAKRPWQTNVQRLLTNFVHLKRPTRTLMLTRAAFIAIALGTVMGFINYSMTPSFILCWLFSPYFAHNLARETNRHAPGWTIASFIVPIWAPALLAILRPKPFGALSLVDNSWFNMERPTNLMMVTGILYFDDQIELEELKNTLSERLLCFDRFHQKVKYIGRFACWVHDSQFDIDHHLSQIELEDPEDPSAFHHLVDRLTATALDFSRPLWKIDIVKLPDGKSAAIFRIHHAIADGIALIRVLLSLTDPVSQVVPASADQRAGSKRPQSGYLEQMVGFAQAIKKGLMLPDSDTSLKNTLTGKRVTAWSEPIDVEHIKVLSHQHNAKINDMVLAVTAGAIRTYLAANGEDVNHVLIRVLVPINLKPTSGPIELGNKVGFVYLPIPVHLEDPIARLRAVKQSMDEIKGGQEALLSYWFLTLMGALPVRLQHAIIDVLNKNASSTMTNVPGPRHKIQLAGHAIENMMFFGPQSGPMGVGISVLSYAGKMTFAINADANLVSNPQILADFFHQELKNWPLG